MKFTGNSTTPDLEEAVAYIDQDGDLRITDGEDVVCLMQGGFVLRFDNHEEDDPWNPAKGTQHFFPGDSVTITF